MENSLELAKAITTPRAAYAAFSRGDFDGALKSLDPQIEWSEPTGVTTDATASSTISQSHAQHGLN